jgi:hypothetical protein
VENGIHSVYACVLKPAFTDREEKKKNGMNSVLQTAKGNNTMPSFNTEVAHQLGKEQATERLKGLMGEVRNKYKDQVSDLQEEWQGDTLNYSFKTYGFTIKGDLKVNEDAIVMNGSLPIAALAFRGKIEQSIRSELEKRLA